MYINRTNYIDLNNLILIILLLLFISGSLKYFNFRIEYLNKKIIKIRSNMV